MVIGSGFAEHTDPAALVVGPTGLTLGRHGKLYVADTASNRISAIPNASTRTRTAFTGADLTDASLLECDLTDADWSNATTRNTNLRGSRIRGLDLRRGPYGVILTSQQVVGLAHDLGVTVIDPAE